MLRRALRQISLVGYHSNLMRTSTRSLRSSAPATARILCADNVSPRCAEIFEDRGHKTVQSAGLSFEELKTELPKYDAVIVRSATKLPAEAFPYGTSLKVIGRAGVGVDNIDLDAATKHGVIVQNTPGGNTQAAAELAFSLLVTLARQVPAANISLREGRWDRKLYKGRELKGKTIGIVGLGSIGQCMAGLCKALGMTVVGHDPMASPEAVEASGAERVFDSLEELMGASDVVSLHVPGGASTEGMLGRAQLKAAKPGCLVVNAARGGVVDAEALLEALEEGWIAGAALDVYDQEPPSTEATKKIVSMPQVVCTPHLGASTEEAQVKVAEQIAEQVCDVLDGRRYVGVVNAKHVALSQQPAGQAVAGLSQSLGLLASSIVEGGAESIQVELSPRLAAKNPAYEELVRSAVLAGALPCIRQDIAEKDVNLINAGALAEVNGVKCTVARMQEDDAADFESVIQVTVASGSGQRSARGAIDAGQPRVIGIDHWSSFPSFAPRGSVLLVQNTDKPGAIGQVARVLANEGTNIAQMSVARQHPGSPALCVLLLDDRVTKATRQRIAGLDGIYSVATASFGGRASTSASI